MTVDERHEDVVRRYPAGLTVEQFRHETLMSADADGKLDPPSITDGLTREGLLICMSIAGLIKNHKHPVRYPGDWRITDKGRAAIQKATNKEQG